MDRNINNQFTLAPGKLPQEKNCPICFDYINNKRSFTEIQTIFCHLSLHRCQTPASKKFI